MRGAITLLPQYVLMAWCLVKHRDKFTFTCGVREWEGTALRYVPVGTVLQSDGAPLHFSSRVHAFLDREFPDRWT